MSRSILLSIMFIAGTLGIIAFSAAQFTDFDTTTSDAITAGTLDLVFVPGTDTALGELSCDFDTDGLEGQSGTPEPAADTQAVCSFAIQNQGSLNNGDLWAMILEVPEHPCDDGTLVDPSEHCDTIANLGAEEFTLVGMTSDGTGAVFPTFGSPLNSYVGGSNCVLLDTDMDDSDTVQGTYTVELIQSLTFNVMQGDSITLVVNFELVEEGGTANCLEDPAAGP